MNKEIFNSMQKQMTPSPGVRTALNEKLARTAKKRPVPWMKYGAVAACAALVIGAYTVYQIGKDHFDYPLYRTVQIHSYVAVDGMSGYVTESGSVVSGGTGESAGDRDMGMTSEDLTAAMLDVGYTQAEADEYQSIGYQMTWAKWWKFVGQQQNSEGGDPFNLDDLKAFSQKELFINTGVLPGGAYVGDVPTQEEAVNAYQKLMDRFNGTYPDWYGGAYIDGSACLVVMLVEDKDPGDKTLELQVLDWTDNGRVAFSTAKYSLAQLTELMDRLNALPDTDMKCGDVMAGWGIDEEHNRIELTLTEVNYQILSVLAELDPDDDMILVQVGQRASIDDALGEVVSTDSAMLEDPAAHHVMPGGVVPPVPEDDGDLIADEPWVDDLDGTHFATEDGGMARRDILELPESKQPASVQSVPEEDSSSCTLAYDPAVGFIYPNT